MLVCCLFVISDPDPTVKEGIKSVKATQIEDDSVMYSLKAKNCFNNFFVYRLPPTVNDQSGYCFGE